uniref:Deoxyribonuclease-2-alpha n=1 Tax=Sander lucioperca TaxID=283035 RepID=A0A8D0AUN3_SANLU
MWRIFLTVSLLCWSADGQVTCRDNNNGEVEWYIIYKAPKLNNIGTTGVEYLYIDSAGKKETSTDHNKPINHPNGVLANTLRPIFTTSMPDNFGFISYSDQPPPIGTGLGSTFGHSKGLMMMEKDKTGVWLLHSTPQFPFERDQNNFYPSSGAAKAQTFICVTFNYDQFQHIGEHLLAIAAFPFDHHIPDGFHKELTQVTEKDLKKRPKRDANQVKSRELTSAGLLSAGLISAGLISAGVISAGLTGTGTSFESIAKHQIKDEMDLVLLITSTFTFSIVDRNEKPCLRNNDKEAYNRFVKKHIIQENFDRNSIDAWQRYITDRGLCDRRRPKQSFFEPGSQGAVEQICQGHGHPLSNHKDNLCISPNTLPFYYVTLDNNCKVDCVVLKEDYVVVACDVIVNQCRPVHFEKHNGQGPDMSAICQKVNAA